MPAVLKLDANLVAGLGTLRAGLDRRDCIRVSILYTFVHADVVSILFPFPLVALE